MLKSFVALLLLTLSSSALAEPAVAALNLKPEPRPRTSLVTFQIGAGSLGFFGASYEKPIHSHFSYALQAGLMGSWNRWTVAGLPANIGNTASAAITFESETQLSSAVGAGALAALHWFPIGCGPEGLWVGPALFADFVRTSSSSSSRSSTSPTFESSNVNHQSHWGAKAQVGYNFIASNGFTASLSFNAGIGFSHASNSSASPFMFVQTGQTIDVGSQVGLGWAF